MIRYLGYFSAWFFMVYYTESVFEHDVNLSSSFFKIYNQRWLWTSVGQDIFIIRMKSEKNFQIFCKTKSWQNRILNGTLTLNSTLTST